MNHRLTQCLCSALLAFSGFGAWAQTATDIYLLDLQALDQSRTVILRITDVPGYDNQPHYSADGKTLYFTRISSGRANVMAYDIANASTRVILADLESDYSPTLMPRVNALSVIRVEADQRQRLWKIPLDGQPPQVIFENIEGVGYHAWAAPRIALMFILGEPPTLQLAGPAGVAQPVAQNIGRAMVAIAGSTEVAYVSKGTGDSRWTINAYDYAIDADRFIAPTLAGQEDFAISPEGTLWMADDSVLYRWTREQPSWVPLIDLSTTQVGAISRMTLSPNGHQLALVAEELEQ
ncbi:MAG: TolB family protein [Lysobacterales bacterium]